MKKILLMMTGTMLLFTACAAKIDTSATAGTVVVSNAGRVIYKADSFNTKEQRLTNIYIIVRNADMSLHGVLRADYADWQGSKWELVNSTQYSPDEYNLRITDVDTEILSGLDEPPETFRRMASAANPVAMLKSNSVMKTKGLTVVVSAVDEEIMSGLVFFDVDGSLSQRITVAREAVVSTPSDGNVLMQLNMSNVILVSFNLQKKGDYDAIMSEQVNMNLPE